jgi:hypothetical protein
MTLGVKWSQVQILSARLRKCVLTCGDRSFIPQEWFSLYVIGTTFLWYLTVLDALVRWSSAASCGRHPYRIIFRGSGKPILM